MKKSIEQRKEEKEKKKKEKRQLLSMTMGNENILRFFCVLTQPAEMNFTTISILNFFNSHEIRTDENSLTVTELGTFIQSSIQI